MKLDYLLYLLYLWISRCVKCIRFHRAKVATRRQQRLGTAMRAVTEVAQVSSEIVTGRSGVEQQVRLDLVL